MKSICSGQVTIRRIVYNQGLDKFNSFAVKATGDLETLADELPEGGQYKEGYELSLEPCDFGILINVKTPEGILGPSLLPWNTINVMKCIGLLRSMYDLYTDLYLQHIEDRKLLNTTSKV